jgi:hypothetical protein
MGIIISRYLGACTRYLAAIACSLSLIVSVRASPVTLYDNLAQSNDDYEYVGSDYLDASFSTASQVNLTQVTVRLYIEDYYEGDALNVDLWSNSWHHLTNIGSISDSDIYDATDNGPADFTFNTSYLLDPGRYWIELTGGGAEGYSDAEWILTYTDAGIGVAGEYAYVGDYQYSNSDPGFPSAFIMQVRAEPVGTSPLPATLPLFASGLGVLSLLGWRSKRKARVAA